VKSEYGTALFAAFEPDLRERVRAGTAEGRTMAVPLAQLAAVDPDNSTAEAIADWHYWVPQRGYRF
jgi:hypothetical protein